MKKRWLNYLQSHREVGKPRTQILAADPSYQDMMATRWGERDACVCAHTCVCVCVCVCVRPRALAQAHFLSEQGWWFLVPNEKKKQNSCFGSKASICHTINQTCLSRLIYSCFYPARLVKIETKFCLKQSSHEWMLWDFLHDKELGIHLLHEG